MCIYLQLFLHYYQHRESESEKQANFENISLISIKGVKVHCFQSFFDPHVHEVVYQLSVNPVLSDSSPPGHPSKRSLKTGKIQKFEASKHSSQVAFIICFSLIKVIPYLREIKLSFIHSYHLQNTHIKKENNEAHSIKFFS